MKVEYQAKHYDAAKVTARYVRHDYGDMFRFCEVGEDARFDVRQGTVIREELPPSILAKAMESEGYFPSYVEWPFASTEALK